MPTDLDAVSDSTSLGYHQPRYACADTCGRWAVFVTAPATATPHSLRKSPGSFAMFAAIRLASSLLSSLAADRLPGSHS